MPPCPWRQCCEPVQQEAVSSNGTTASAVIFFRTRGLPGRRPRLDNTDKVIASLFLMKPHSLALIALCCWLCPVLPAADITGTWILEGGKTKHRFEVEIVPATDSTGGYWLVHTEGIRLVYEGRYELRNTRLVRVDSKPKEYDGIAFRSEGERWLWAGDRKNNNLAPYAGSLLRRPKTMAADALFNELGQGRLYIAALNNDSKEILRLLNTGTPVDSPNKDRRRRTALYAAIDMDYVDLVAFLLEKGADVNQTDRDGITPLMAAGQSSGPYPQLIRLLLDKGANAGIKDKQGLTAMERLEKAKAVNFRDTLMRELASRKKG